MSMSTKQGCDFRIDATRAVEIVLRALTDAGVGRQDGAQELSTPAGRGGIDLPDTEPFHADPRWVG
jgi:hypothetical protein